MPTEEQLLEILRLALLGGERASAQRVTLWLADAWIGVSRFREVRDLCRQTLAVERTPRTLSYLAHATRVLGDVAKALRLSLDVLEMCEEAGDREGLVSMLSDIGTVYLGMGELARALEYYQQALALCEAAGDRQDEWITRYNIAMVHWMQGRLREAVDELRQVVALDEQVHSPHLASDRALLTQVQAEPEGS